MFLDPLSISSGGFVTTSNDFIPLNISMYGYLLTVEVIEPISSRRNGGSYAEEFRREIFKRKSEKFIKITVKRGGKTWTKVEKVNIKTFNIRNISIEEIDNEVTIRVNNHSRKSVEKNVRINLQ